jgi:hypothetical protein
MAGSKLRGKPGAHKRLEEERESGLGDGGEDRQEGRTQREKRVYRLDTKIVGKREGEGITERISKRRNL